MKLRIIALTAALAACLAATAAPVENATPPDSATIMPADASHLLTAKDMNDKQVTNPLDAINGRVAGLTITHGNNGVAAMEAVRVRGTTSLTGGNDPLIIIDGVMGDLRTLSSIYPTDIESFNVLKDASQTAQYGSRGASGVIEVTTKKGATGRATVSYNGSCGFASVAKNLKMLDADGYRRAVTERGLMLIDLGYNTNWQRVIEQTGWQHDHHLAFSGGGKDNGYRVALGYMDHDGVILHENLRNFTSNMSMYQNMFHDLLKIEVGMFGNVLKEKTAIYDVQKTFYSAAAFIPTFPASANASGGYDGFTYANQINHPLALMDSRTTNKTTHLSTHAKLTFNLGKGWTLSAFGAYSHNEVERDQYLPTSIWANGQAYRGTDKAESLLGDITANYKVTIGKNTFDFLALAEAQSDTYTGFCTTTTNFSQNELGFYSIQAGAISLWEGTKSYYERPTLAAFMGRASWDFASRYSLTVSARADGSSKFGANHKWGFFPSISGTWTLSNEAFMKPVKWIDNLRLSAGYGLAGNQGGIDSYTSMRMVQPMGVVPVGEKQAVALGNMRNSQHLVDVQILVAFHISLYHAGIERVEHVLAKCLIHHPQNFSDVCVALLLTQRSVLRHGIQAQQIESNAVGHDIVAVHQLQLTLRIAILRLLIQRIVGTQILVETDANRVVTHNHALVQRTNLCVNLRNLYAWQILAQILKSRCQVGVDVIHIGILLLSLGYQHL